MGGHSPSADLFQPATQMTVTVKIGQTVLGPPKLFRPAMSQPVVAIIAFDRISPFHLSVPCVVFGAAPGRAVIPAAGLRRGAGAPRTTAGFDISMGAIGLQALDGADIIIAPSWRDPAERPPQPLLDRLAAAHRRGARIVGLCLGAYVLAEAGMLDGRRATTHWAYAQDFARRLSGGGGWDVDVSMSRTARW